MRQPTSPSPYPDPVWPMRTVKRWPDVSAYMGSPSVIKTGANSYLVTNDGYKGGLVPGSPSAPTYVSYSNNTGATWTARPDITGMFWANLFRPSDAAPIHLLGTDGENGNIVIAKTTNDGTSWTKATLFNADDYHTAPCKGAVKNGRYYRIFERIKTVANPATPMNTGRPEVFFVLDAAVGADLLNPASWTKSAEHLHIAADGGIEWLEGHLVELPEDEGTPYLTMIFRIMFGGNNIGKAKFNTVTRSITLDASPNPYHECPFGWCKFSPVKCPVTGYFIVAGNDRPHADPGTGAEDRTVPSLWVTRNFTAGSYRKVYEFVDLYDIHGSIPNLYQKMGVQYPDLILDGLRMVTVWRDATDGSNDYHNAIKTSIDIKENYLPILHNL